MYLCLSVPVFILRLTAKRTTKELTIFLVKTAAAAAAADADEDDATSAAAVAAAVFLREFLRLISPKPRAQLLTPFYANVVQRLVSPVLSQ